MPSQPHRIGLIGLDTSHVAAFTKLLNDPEAPHHVPGGKVVAGYPGGTPDWDKSAGRVDGFTAQLGDEFGVEILDSPEAVAERVDLVFITSVDGRSHRELLDRVLSAGKPVFIDKPFAATVEDAEAMVAAAEAQGVPLMACSSLRYAEPFERALADDSLGAITGIDVYGPMALEPALPGLLWYGCHGIEMMVAAMGAGCAAVRATVTEGADVHVMRWSDGRIASYRGRRDGGKGFGATIHRAEGAQQIDASGADKPYYAGLLEAIMRSLPEGRSDVPAEQMIEVVRVMLAGNAARERDETVSLTGALA
ncbi:MAG: Gfo/Idh/MocA family protein [Phycisphaeraceae bacterium]